MARRKAFVLVSASLMALCAGGVPPIARASAIVSSSGSVVYARSYGDGSGGVRLELGVSSGASHNCGTQPTVYYFDASKIGADTTKAIIAIATAAMVSGELITLTYDCTIGGGGYGWGIGLSASS